LLSSTEAKISKFKIPKRVLVLWWVSRRGEASSHSASHNLPSHGTATENSEQSKVAGLIAPKRDRCTFQDGWADCQRMSCAVLVQLELVFSVSFWHLGLESVGMNRNMNEDLHLHRSINIQGLCSSQSLAETPAKLAQS
jgi:hypothetical protein